MTPQFYKEKSNLDILRAKEKPQISLLAEMRQNIYKFKWSEKQYLLEPAYTSLIVLVFIEKYSRLFRSQTIIKYASNNRAYEIRTRLFSQSGKPNEGCSEPFYD